MTPPLENKGMYDRCCIETCGVGRVGKSTEKHQRQGTFFHTEGKTATNQKPWRKGPSPGSSEASRGLWEQSAVQIHHSERNLEVTTCSLILTIFWQAPARPKPYPQGCTETEKILTVHAQVVQQFADEGTVRPAGVRASDFTVGSTQLA